MRTRLQIVIGLLLLLLQAFPAQRGIQAAGPLWQLLAPGIEYREYFLPGPNHIYVARMQRSNSQVTLESSIGQGRLSGGSETVRDQAARYDQALNTWGGEWGPRNQVVVAINGSFFDPQTGVPWSGQIQSGWYAKRFTDRQNSTGFIWTDDRRAFVGACVVHRPGKQIITLSKTGETFPFDGINIPHGENDLILFTPQYDAATPGMKAGDQGIELLVELTQPLGFAPEPSMISGTVRQVVEGTGQTPIPFESVVLSATGKAARSLKGKIAVGDRLGFSQELRHLMPDCQTPNPQSWEGAYSGVSGSFTFLSDGAIAALDDLGAVLRNPRTAIAFNDAYVFFIVVDGRDRLRSLGMSMAELGVFAKTHLGATWGIAMDGGGSSTMVVNGVVVNSPNAELDKPAPSVTPSPTEAAASPARIERVVANGMLMIEVLSKEQSNRFRAGQTVSIIESGQVNLRLGPGTNYGVLGVATPGQIGTILDHPLNGVLAKGYYWWKIDFGGLVGWVNQDSLG
jgi:exopolysaccharide biosynthesis protein